MNCLLTTGQRSDQTRINTIGRGRRHRRKNHPNNQLYLGFYSIPTIHNQFSIIYASYLPVIKFFGGGDGHGR